LAPGHCPIKHFWHNLSHCWQALEILIEGMPELVLINGATTFDIKTLRILALSIMTLSILTLSILTLSILTLCILTLSILTFFDAA
jgi:hypothetical protein